MITTREALEGLFFALGCLCGLSLANLFPRSLVGISIALVTVIVVILVLWNP